MSAGSTRPVRILVLRSPGANCDRETVHAFERVGTQGSPVAVAAIHVNRLLEDRSPLEDADLLCVPGGFSYGDDLGAGKVLGNKLALRLRDAVLGLVERGGLVLGICNGFQVLVRSGLLPGLSGKLEPEAALARNLSGKFEARWTRLEVVSGTRAALSPLLARGEILDLPVAHGEGRLVLRDASALAQLRANGQIALVYRRPAPGEHPGVSGKSVAPGPAGYPWNPAASLEDIAGITDPTGRILGLMPHPERSQDPWQRPGFLRERARGEPGSAPGLELFRRAVQSLERRSGSREKVGAFQ